MSPAILFAAKRESYDGSLSTAEGLAFSRSVPQRRPFHEAFS
jgi:hypothetical protein